MRAPGVETVAHWNQSNWPALVRKRSHRVHTATSADRARLCALWQREHSYQSFPILLGCPGRRPQEYEPCHRNENAIVRIPCASIDLSSEPVVAGGIFTRRDWFRVSHCTHPPKPCAGTRVERYPSGVGIAMSVYPTGIGHFVPEQLPRVLLLHRFIPPHVPILVADSPFVRRYLQPLIDHSVMPSSRIVFHRLRGDGTMLHASSVYTSLNSHFSNIMNGDAAMLAARDTLSRLPPRPVPPAQRTHVLIIDRSTARSRGVSNAAHMLKAIRRTLTEFAASAAGREGVVVGANGGRSPRVGQEGGASGEEGSRDERARATLRPAPERPRWEKDPEQMTASEVEAELVASRNRLKEVHAEIGRWRRGELQLRGEEREPRASTWTGVSASSSSSSVEIAKSQSLAARVVSGLSIQLWSPANTTLDADVAAFRKAAVIIAPHGAGLANMLFASPNTAVIEICYDSTAGMACPAMYAAMATNLHLPYWVVTGEGGYGTPMIADLTQLRCALRAAVLTADAEPVLSPR